VTASRDELHHLIDELPDDKVSAVLADVRRLSSMSTGKTEPFAWVGKYSSTNGRTDNGRRVDELLAEGFAAGSRG